jgi:hypothetical protein
LRRWLATEGKLGEPPDDYALFKAAEYMRIPTPSIVDVPIWWIDKALDYMSAESEAQEIIANRKK